MPRSSGRIARSTPGAASRSSHLQARVAERGSTGSSSLWERGWLYARTCRRSTIPTRRCTACSRSRLGSERPRSATRPKTPRLYVIEPAHKPCNSQKNGRILLVWIPASWRVLAEADDPGAERRHWRAEEVLGGWLSTPELRVVLLFGVGSEKFVRQAVGDLRGWEREALVVPTVTAATFSGAKCSNGWIRRQRASPGVRSRRRGHCSRSATSCRSTARLRRSWRLTPRSSPFKVTGAAREEWAIFRQAAGHPEFNATSRRRRGAKRRRRR